MHVEVAILYTNDNLKSHTCSLPPPPANPQVLANLPVSARALNKRGIGGIGGVNDNVYGRSNSSGSAWGSVGGGGISASHRQRRNSGSEFSSGNPSGRSNSVGVIGGGDRTGMGVGGVERIDGKGRPASIVAKLRAMESFFVADWVFEPESAAVGMRDPSFEGPLVSVCVGV